MAPTAAALAVTMLLPLPAQATNGYFSDGCGAKAQALGGAGIALPQDGLAAASNPAGTADVGNRFDIGFAWFAPRRGATTTGNRFGADAGLSGDGKKNFYVPELDYARRLSDRLAAGRAMFGNGGLNADYGSNPYARFGASGAAGVNLEQHFVAPSPAFKLSDTQALGPALNLAHQRFAPKAIAVFDGVSSAPGHVSDQGTDTSNGGGSIPPGNPPAGLGGGNAKVRLTETILGASYAWKL